MKNITKNLIRVVSSLFVAGAFLVAPAAQATSNLVDMNCLSNEGWKMVRVQMLQPVPVTDDSVLPASAGDRISVRIHYHNFTQSAVANNVQMSFSTPSGSTTNKTITGRLWASNSNVYTDTVTVNISSAQTLTFIPGSVKWDSGVNSYSRSTTKWSIW